LRLRLTRKFAEFINGIDLSRTRAGDLLDLPERDANVLMAEGWAVPANGADVMPRAEAADRPVRRSTPKPKEHRP
jgi:hypothetical protein